MTAGDRTGSVTVAITGGLGNQMFQYAAGRALAVRCKAPLVLDLAFYNDRRHRKYELDAFPIAASGVTGNAGNPLARWMARRREGTVYREPHFHYDPAFERLTAPVRLEGYFPSPRYFAGYEDTVRHDLAPPAADDAESRRLAPRIASGDAIALHVRRGDYVSRPKINQLMGTCSVAYYEAALARIPGDGTVFVFSDDIAWAKANLPRTRPTVFVGEASPRAGLADLWLMALARHHIIANSSFSWWGAWLGQRPDGTTIAPARWFADSANDVKDLFPASWIRIAG
jgi:hypothetical protein